MVCSMCAHQRCLAAWELADVQMLNHYFNLLINKFCFCKFLNNFGKKKKRVLTKLKCYTF